MDSSRRDDTMLGDGVTFEDGMQSAPRARRRVCVLLTGGTMACQKQPDGSLAPSKGYLASQMATMPELTDANMPEYTLVEYDPLIDSSDMSPTDWTRIASDIEGRYVERTLRCCCRRRYYS